MACGVCSNSLERTPGRVADAGADCAAGRNFRSQRREADVDFEQGGFVQSQRGTKGGYRLSRPASVIHLNEVISVLTTRVSRHTARATRACWTPACTRATAGFDR